MFKKCLFRIENLQSNKQYKLYQYFLNNKLELTKNDEEIQFKLKLIEQKLKEEKENNAEDFKKKIGEGIVFGQEIQLRHVHSNTFLTYNPNVLARQEGGIKVFI